MPQEKLELFYNAIKENPSIKGLPKDYATFRNVLSDEGKASSFFDAIKDNKSIEGLPDSFESFSNGLGLKKKETTLLGLPKPSKSLQFGSPNAVNALQNSLPNTSTSTLNSESGSEGSDVHPAVDKTFKEYPGIKSFSKPEDYLVQDASGKMKDILNKNKFGLEFQNKGETEYKVGLDRVKLENPDKHRIYINPDITKPENRDDAVKLDILSHAFHNNPSYNRFTDDLKSKLIQKYGEKMVNGNGGVDAYVRGYLSNSKEYEPYKKELAFLPKDYFTKLDSILKTDTSSNGIHPAVARFNKKHNTNLTNGQIQGKEPIPEKMGAFDAFSHNVVGGLSNLAGDFVHAPRNLARMAATPLMDIAGMDDTKKKAFFDYIDNTDNTTRNLNILGDALKMNGEDLTKLTQNRENADNLFAKGDYLQAAKEYGVEMGHIVPLLMGSALGGTIPTGAAMISGHFNNVKDRTDMSETDKTNSAMLHGIIDMGALQMGQRFVGGQIGSLLEKQGLEATKKTVEKTILGTIKETLKPFTPLTAPLLGYAEGYAYQVASNLVDKHTDPTKKDIALNENADHTGKLFSVISISGQGIGQAHRGIERISSTIADRKLKDKAIKAEEHLNNIDNIIDNPEVPETVKDNLVHQRKKAVTDLNNIAEEHAIQVESLPIEVKEKVEELNNQHEDISVALESDKLPDEEKTILEDQQKQIEGDLTQILKDHATKKRNIEENDLDKHSDGDQGGEADQTGNSNSIEQSGEKQKEITEEQKSEINTDAKTYGFDSAPHAQNAVKKYLNKEYDTYAEIPKSELKETAKLRNEAKAKENIDTESGSASTNQIVQNKSELESLNEQLTNAKTKSKKEEIQSKIADLKDGKTIGIRHESLKKIAIELGLDEPMPGQVMDPREYVERGRKLLKGGADINKIAEDFKNDGKISVDAFSVVRAHNEVLAKSADEAYKKFGHQSEEYKVAKEKLQEFQKNVVKPMATVWAESGRVMQGETDIETGSFVELQSAAEAVKGGPLTPDQTGQIKRQADIIQKLTVDLEDVIKKLDAAHNSETSDISPKRIKEKSKQIAESIRKGKLSRPGIFSAASPASIVWDGALETAAKTVELTGDTAQALADAITHIKSSEWYKGLTDEKKIESEAAVRDYFKDTIENKDIPTRFADKKDNSFSSEEAKAIWDYAKEFLDKGRTFSDMLKNVSLETGLTPSQIRSAIATPKTARIITDEMYLKQNRRALALAAAKKMVRDANTSKLERTVMSIPDFFFKLATYGHGTVGGITHAAQGIYRPSEWKRYIPFFLKQFQFAYGNTARYEQAMEDLQLKPNFAIAKRAGLANDPLKIYDDYQGNYSAEATNKFSQLFKRLGVAGDRGFNALKVLRQDLFDIHYDNLSDIDKKDKKVIEAIADQINHSTGTVGIKPSAAWGKIFFAPKLELSKWANLIADPVKSAGTFATWKYRSPAQKASAKITARRSGEALAVYASLLATNAAINSLVYPDDKDKQVNWKDALKSDFGKFKIGSKEYDASGGILSSIRFVASIMNQIYMARAGVEGQKDSPETKAKVDLLTQARYKLAPGFGLATDLAFGTDAIGRPLPEGLSAVKNKRFEPYKLWEYALSKAPIPLAEGGRVVMEEMKQKGMTDADISTIMNGIYSAVISGGTGVKVKESEKRHPFSSETEELDKHRTEQNKAKSEKSAIKKEEHRKKIDEYNETTEEEKDLRKKMDDSAKDHFKIIHKELLAIPPDERLPTLKRWRKLDIVSDDLFKEFDLSDPNEIKVK